MAAHARLMGMIQRRRAAAAADRKATKLDALAPA
jgi:hypothetical protein